ncbi:MAG: CsbD family protein [Acidimicrobiia bacterium]|nr:CsbD family protein [Acidimicrobiia bacterium]
MGAQSDQAKGKLKEAAGTLTGNQDLESEGKADRRAGEAKEKVADVKGKVDEAADTVAKKAGMMIDKVKHALHRK